MFEARGVIVCLALFGVMYGALSCLVAAAWYLAQRMHRTQASAGPGALLAMRILPFAVSALFAVFFTLPSFWLMERRSLDEDAATFFLALAALLLLFAGFVRALRAARRTSRAVAQWLHRAGEANTANQFSLSSAAGAPALMLIGICRPRVMVSEMAAGALSENELRVAVRHELQHKRSCDNLKKLLMNAIPFPGMSGIERAWREAAELAADDAAVETRQDALDLATALLKLSRPATRWNEPEIASALVCGSSAVTTRVHRLLAWRRSARLSKPWPWAVAALLTLALVVTNYGTALVMTHRLTELLVP